MAGFTPVSSSLFEMSDLTTILEYQENSGFPIILDIAMLADILGVRKQTVCWLRKEKNQQYKFWTIPKKGKANKGKFRKLQEPRDRMMYIQKQIKKKILDPVELLLPDYITGFRKGKKIRDTAEAHTKKKIVVSLDLRHYFNSIKQKHLQEVFKDYFQYPEDVSRFLSELCTYKFFVPEGSPTSPSLSNIVGYFYFDKEVKKIADEEGFTYTRYADDLTLSTDKEFPREKLSDSEGNEYVKSGIDNVITKISDVLKSKGFTLNTRKTKIMRSPARQFMLGMVVNEEPNLLRRKRQILKCILYNIKENGIAEEAKKTNRTELQFLEWIRGQISYFTQVNEIKGVKLKEKFDFILKSNNYNELTQEVPIL